MSAFQYRNGQLFAEAVSVAHVAEAVGTPFYCYSTAALQTEYRNFDSAFAKLPHLVCYSLKANNNLAVMRTLVEMGSGADVVSAGELHCALAAGVPPDKIVFAGVGKTAPEMAAALDAGILQFNVESVPELELLNQVAVGKNKRAPVALRLNPDVDARTHAKISTGKSENKFGIELSQGAAAYAQAANSPGLEPVGLALHIGSQLTDLAPYRAAFTKLAAMAKDLRQSGLPVKRLDLGGGLGIAYDGDKPPSLADYASVVEQTVGSLGLPLIFEPGRRLTGNAGILVMRVTYVKEGVNRSFIIADAAMNDLIRPMLYEAYHDILPVQQAAPEAQSRRVDIVGPICESTDIFAEQRPMPPLAAGDLLAIFSTGAYGAVMASSYNLRPQAPEVMVNGHEFAIVRPRPTYADMIGRDRLPGWFSAGPKATDRRSA
jgi:diaminopimelate decarboxylase